MTTPTDIPQHLLDLLNVRDHRGYNPPPLGESQPTTTTSVPGPVMAGGNVPLTTTAPTSTTAANSPFPNSQPPVVWENGAGGMRDAGIPWACPDATDTKDKGEDAREVSR